MNYILQNLIDGSWNHYETWDEAWATAKLLSGGNVEGSIALMNGAKFSCMLVVCPLPIWSKNIWARNMIG